MDALNRSIHEYQDDMRDIIADLQMRTNKLKSNTYPERIDELNNMLNVLRKQIEILADDLTKIENEQLSAERSAEELRERTLSKLNISYEQNSFDINGHILDVMKG